MDDDNKYNGKELLVKHNLGINSTDAEVEHAVQMEAANEGIELPFQPIPPTFENVDPPDLTLYTVKGQDYSSQEQAEMVATAIQMAGASEMDTKHDTDIYGHYSYNNDILHYAYHSPVCHCEVGSKVVYSEKLWNAVKPKVIENKRRKDEFTNATALYDKATEGLAEIRQAITGEIYRLQNIEYRKQQLVKQYNEHLSLAANNTSIAENFFMAAHRNKLVEMNMTVDQVRELATAGVTE